MAFFEGSKMTAGYGDGPNIINSCTIKVDRGEIVAILGPNGAGKSTLLQSIAGLLRPTEGEIRTNGRVILLAGTDPGFISEITGRQNVMELALAYGVSNKELTKFVESVENFANIGEAFDRKFLTYSTGMRGKVGFGFITALKPDILLMDETLGVGDREFSAKAAKRLEKFIQRAGTVIISTHSLGLAKEICSRGIILDFGEVYLDSNIEEN